MESRSERRRFREIVAGLEDEITDPFDTEHTDGWDSTPRPFELGTPGEDQIPKGHIALQGDFGQVKPPPTDSL